MFATEAAEMATTAAPKPKQRSCVVCEPASGHVSARRGCPPTPRGQNRTAIHLATARRRSWTAAEEGAVAFTLLSGNVAVVWPGACSISAAAPAALFVVPYPKLQPREHKTGEEAASEEGREREKLLRKKENEHDAPRRAVASRLRCGASRRRRGRHRRSSSERQLRGGPGQVAAGERHGGEGRQRHPAVGDVGLRGVHRVRAQAGRHAAGGAAGRARRAAGQRGLHPPAPRRDPGRLLRHHLQRGAHLRAGGAAQRVGEPRVGRPPHADHLRQQRLGLVRVGVQGQVRHCHACHPQPRRRGGPRLRPAHRRRRDPGAVPAEARQGEHAQERRLRGGALLPAQRVVGRARAAQHRGRPLAAAVVDDRVVQGRQVRRLGALRRAAGRARRGARRRAGERAGAGGAHSARVDLPPDLRRGRRRRRMHGVHGRRGLRGARHRQGAVRVQGHRRVQARRARLHGHRQPHTRRLPEHVLSHEGRRHALRSRHRRRLARRRPQEAGRPPPVAAVSAVKHHPRPEGRARVYVLTR